MSLKLALKVSDDDNVATIFAEGITDGTEVEIAEAADYGDTDMRSIIEGDSRNYRDEDSFADNGYQTKEFDENEELVDVDEEDEETDEEFADDETVKDPVK